MNQRLSIGIHPLFWLMASLIGFLNSGSLLGTAVWITVILVSVLIHELGHALTAIAFGQNAEVQLVALGGLTSRSGGSRLSLFKEFLVVMNGPLAGLALCFACYYLMQVVPNQRGLLFVWLEIAWIANLFWTIVNLLPIQPLDGGKLLAIILEALFGFRGVKVSYFISIVAGAGLALLCFSYGALFIGAILMIFAFESFRMWQASLPMSEQDTSDNLQDELQRAQTHIANGNYTEAEGLLRDVRTQGGSGVLSVHATEMLASAYGGQKRYQEAYDLLQPIQKKLNDQGLILLLQLTYHLGRWRDAANLGDKVFQFSPTVDIALLNARIHARLGELEPTIGWLRYAKNAGFSNFSELLEHADFEGVRSKISV